MRSKSSCTLLGGGKVGVLAFDDEGRGAGLGGLTMVGVIAGTTPRDRIQGETRFGN